MIQTLSSEAFAAVFARHHGLAREADPEQTLAEVLRHLLCTQPAWTRRGLLDHVVAMTTHLPLEALRERARGVLRALEQRGDVSVGERGQLAAGPLRLVEEPDGRALVICGATTSALRVHLGASLSVAGTQRHLPTLTDTARGAARALGGLVLSAGVWAGLEREPAADERFLELWSQRLDAAPTIAALSGVLGDGALEQYRPTRVGRRWVAPELGDLAILLRARSAGRWWRSALVRRAGPALRCLEVSRDTARRLRFAMDRAAGQLVSIELTNLRPGVLCVEVPALLPLAEYRYLMLAAREVLTSRLPMRYALDEESARVVLETLRARLGVTINDRRAKEAE